MKVVKVHTLSQGDHFVFHHDIKDEKPYVYVVTATDVHKWIDCVCLQTGKDFAVGPYFDVVPVTVDLKLKFEREPKVVDLTRKCGSCVYASTDCKELYKNQSSYVRCVNANRAFKHKYSAYRARTTKCCQFYKPKEGLDDCT